MAKTATTSPKHSIDEVQAVLMIPA